MNLYEEIGFRIRLWREEKGLTQEELGQQVGLTRTSITNIEAGGQKVQVDVLYAIAQALKITVDKLLPPEEKGITLIDNEQLKGIPSYAREWVKSALFSNWRGNTLIKNKIQRATAKTGTESIIRDAGIKEPPVDIERIARLQDVEVRYAPYKGEGEIAGCLFQSLTSIIAINSSESRERQRFTIAHLLGYLMIHGSTEFHLDLDFSVTEIKDEQRANELALELLIPRNFLERDLKGKALDFEDDSEIRGLAEKYRVSSQLMTLRLSSKIFN